MEGPKTSITTLHLRNLMNDLSVQQAKASIRFRLLGEMWKPNFMRVTKVTDRGAILMDETTQEFVFVPDVNNIIQIEVDDRFHDLQPHFHYEVISKS